MADADDSKASDSPASVATEAGQTQANESQALANRTRMLDNHVDQLLDTSKRTGPSPKRAIKKKRKQRRMCKFYSNGHCKFGKGCHFTHVGRSAIQAKRPESDTCIVAAITHGAIMAVLEHRDRHPQ